MFNKAKPLTIDPRSIIDTPAPPTPNYLDLHPRINEETGEPEIHVAYIEQSDLHFFSFLSRAKKISRFHRIFASDRLDLNGDIVGGIEIRKLTSWEGIVEKFLSGETFDWARQCFAQFIQKAASGTEVNDLEGNHEIEIDRHWAKAKKILGINFLKRTTYRDANGDVFGVEHSHRFDEKIFPTMEQQNEANSFGDSLLSVGGKVNLFVQEQLTKRLPETFKKLLENFSVVTWCKHKWKSKINTTMGIIDAIENEVNYDPTRAGIIVGHSHMRGIHKTQAAYIKDGRLIFGPEKLIINGGSSTDRHPEGVMIDDEGRKATFELYRDHLAVTMANGFEYEVHFPTLLRQAFPERAKVDADFANSFSKDIKMPESEYTRKADKILALLPHLFPTLDRVESEYGDFTKRVLWALPYLVPAPIKKGFKQIESALEALFPGRDLEKSPDQAQEENFFRAPKNKTFSQRLHEKGDLVNRLIDALSMEPLGIHEVTHYVPPIQPAPLKANEDIPIELIENPGLTLEQAEREVAQQEWLGNSSMYRHLHQARADFAVLEELRRNNPYLPHVRKLGEAKAGATLAA